MLETGRVRLSRAHVVMHEQGAADSTWQAGRPGLGAGRADFEMPITQPRGLLETKAEIGIWSSGERLRLEV